MPTKKKAAAQKAAPAEAFVGDSTAPNHDPAALNKTAEPQEPLPPRTREGPLGPEPILSEDDLIRAESEAAAATRSK